MKLSQALTCFIVLTVQDGVAVSSQNIHEVKEGENITVQCSFNFSGTRKYFCKNKCEDRNVLIETTDNEAQNGRYSIEYKEGFYPTTSTVLYVSITQLKKSDSGRYSCRLDRTYLFDGFEDFEIFVTDASTTLKPTSTSVQTVTRVGPPGQLSVLLTGGLVVVLLPVVVLLVYNLRTEDCVCLKRKRNSDHINTEMVLYENCSPVSTCDDSTYQSLHPATRDLNQIYSTLTPTQ